MQPKSLWPMFHSVDSLMKHSSRRKRLGRAMNVKSAVFEFEFVRSAVYVDLGGHLIRTEEDRPFGIFDPGQARYSATTAE
jgi:hypothetical protein